MAEWSEVKPHRRWRQNVHSKNVWPGLGSAAGTARALGSHHGAVPWGLGHPAQPRPAPPSLPVNSVLVPRHCSIRPFLSVLSSLGDEANGFAPNPPEGVRRPRPRQNFAAPSASGLPTAAQRGRPRPRPRQAAARHAPPLPDWQRAWQTAGRGGGRRQRPPQSAAGGGGPTGQAGNLVNKTDTLTQGGGSVRQCINSSMRQCINASHCALDKGGRREGRPCAPLRDWTKHSNTGTCTNL